MQQAIFVTEAGRPLTKKTRPIPNPIPGYAQIKVTATQLLPHDTYGRDSGLFIGKKLPFVLGTNIAGIVTGLPETDPPSPFKYQIGDAIFGLGSPLHPIPDMSGLQEYALLQTAASAKIPPGFSAEQAVTFPVNAVTSYEALFHPTMGFGFQLPLPSPSVPTPHSTSPSPPTNPAPNLAPNAIPHALLIIGGNSSVGRLAIQFARLAKIPQILTIASPASAPALKSLGATHVIDRHLSPAAIRSTIHALLPSDVDGLSHIYDCVSWTYALALSLMSPTRPSTLLTLHPKEPAEAVVRELGLQGLVTVKFVIGNSAFFEPLTEGFWAALPGWIGRRELEVGEYRVIEGLDLGLIEEGLDGYRDGERVVPVVVRVAKQ